jgi:hypothetical protein
MGRFVSLINQPTEGHSMKNTARISLILFFVLLLASAFFLSTPVKPIRFSGSLFLPGKLEKWSSSQQSPGGDKLVLGGSFILEQGEVLEGDLFVLGRLNNSRGNHDSGWDLNC